MSSLRRFSVAMEESLFGRLGDLVRKSRYANRSEFIRDLVRDRLVEQEWQGNAVVVGTITLVYDHETRELSRKLTHLQHHHHELVLATTHVHLDEHMCAEMVLARGPARRIQEIANLLRQQKGVLHARLALSSTGQALT